MVGLPSRIPQHGCACPKQGHIFLSPNVGIIVVFNDFMWEMDVRFVDISGIVDNYCLNIFVYNITSKDFSTFLLVRCMVFNLSLPVRRCTRYNCKPLIYGRSVVSLWYYISVWHNKANNKITELRTILQRESQNAYEDGVYTYIFNNSAF